MRVVKRQRPPGRGLRDTMVTGRRPPGPAGRRLHDGSAKGGTGWSSREGDTSAMRVRPDGAETRATWEIWRSKISRLTSPARMIAKSDVSPRARALLLFSTRRWAGSD